MRRRFSRALSLLLLSSMMVVIAAERAYAADLPSVKHPDLPSVPITGTSVAARPPDAASHNALKGNQPANTSPPEGGGTAGVTSLAPSASWAVSGHTGTFTWSYPLRVPPVPGGLSPELALSYSSSTVDGRTSATNNQPSWVGEGWDLSAGFIERSYGGCAADDEGGTIAPKTGDLCWSNDNAFAGFSAGGGMLLHEGGKLWRSKTDNGERITRETGATNGDDNGEYWVITTTDGVQYHFGSRPEAKSTWTVPVFGDDDNEPCHGATFAASQCRQAWRWNLDKVVDTNGNVIHYNYLTETNRYGLNLQDAGVDYVRGGTLDNIQYGIRDGVVAASVHFGLADRCVPGSDCIPAKKENWPDVAWSGHCDTATCPGRYSPAFFSTKRLSTVTTKVLRNGALATVDSWTLEHAFPGTESGDPAALWLKSIVHTGHVDTAITLPAVAFEGALKRNRVLEDGYSRLNRYRITGIVTEAGAAITIRYADPDCIPGVSMPANPETNTLRCFQVRWAKAGHPERVDYFHKYVVAGVTVDDRFGVMEDEETSYEYLGGAAWHSDTSEFIDDDKRMWNEYRGYGRVQIHLGSGKDGPKNTTEQRYYRGMHGDRLPSGTRSVTVQDSNEVSYEDSDWLAGMLFESTAKNGESEVSKSITVPSVQGPTAQRGVYKAYIIRPGTQTEHIALESGGWRVTRTESKYDDRGQLLSVSDLGDTATTADDRCTRTTYVRNTEKWIVSLPSTSETTAVACTATASLPADALGGGAVAYDGGGIGEAPLTGNVTRTTVISARPAAAPVYVQTAEATHDRYGRVKTATDALGVKSTVTYGPAAGPTTDVTVTNALGHSATTTLDPAWGLPVKVVDANGRTTETAYDALGRTIEVWQANRSRAAGADGNVKVSYLVRNDAATVTTVSRLNAKGLYNVSKTVFYGLYRPRQTQTPAVGGGRVLTDTRYDSHGRQHFTATPFFSDTPLDDRLWRPSDVDTVGVQLTSFDGAGRPVAEVFKGGGVEKWRTTTAYGGDRVHVVPPQGAIATTTIVNARGQESERRQYHTGVASGSHDATQYAYDKAGRLASMTTAAGSTWRYTYDLRNRLIRTDDVDKGTATSTFDNAGRLLTTTDARGITLSHAYDALGRHTSVKNGTDTLAEWTYDAAPYGKGLPATTTRYVGGAAYRTSVNGYNQLNLPTGTSVTLPESEAGPAKSYRTTVSYKPDGSLSSVAYPAVGDLPAETVNHHYNDLGLPSQTSGNTFYVSDTSYTRLAEPRVFVLGEVTGKRAWQSFYYEDHTRRMNRTIVDAELPTPMQSDIRYERDAAGNILSIKDVPIGQTADVQCFRYDYLRRLTEAWTPGADCSGSPASATLAGPAPYRNAYTYDKAGNRLTEAAVTAAGTKNSTYSYPASGPRAHAVTSVTSGLSVAQYRYDAVGNMTARPGQTLEWDAEGRLAKVTGDSEASYVYNADGVKLLRKDAGGITMYLDGQELRHNKSDGRLSATRAYTHGGKQVAVRTGAGVSWVLNDHQGTVQFAIDTESMKVNKRRQTPFGVARGPRAPLPVERGFVGGTAEPTGLLGVGARSYDAALGRFVSVDPVMGDEPQLINAYSYANNSPVTHSDPTGLYCDSCDYYAQTKGEASVHDQRMTRPPWKSQSGPYVKPMPGKGFFEELRYRQKYPDFSDGASTPSLTWNRPACADGGKSCKMPEPSAGQSYREHQEMQRLRGEAAQQLVRSTLGTLAEKLPVDNIHLLATELGFSSYSICVQGRVSGVIAGGGVGGCVNVDSTGLSTSASIKGGAELGVGADVSLVVRLNSETAAEVDKGLSFEAEAGLTIKAGVGAGGKYVWELGGDGSAVEVEIGFGGRAAILGVHANLSANSGYLVKWCQMGIC